VHPRIFHQLFLVEEENMSKCLTWNAIIGLLRTAAKSEKPFYITQVGYPEGIRPITSVDDPHYGFISIPCPLGGKNLLVDPANPNGQPLCMDDGRIFFTLHGASYTLWQA
jgi:hypothetical protein